MYQLSDIALDYGLDDRGSSSGRGWEFFSSPLRPDRFWIPLSLLYNGYQGLFPGEGIKWPGREANHSPPSSAEAKNAWSYTSIHPIHLHGMVLRNKAEGLSSGDFCDDRDELVI
jgi:hypothetical protein